MGKSVGSHQLASIQFKSLLPSPSNRHACLLHEYMQAHPQTHAHTCSNANTHTRSCSHTLSHTRTRSHTHTHNISIRTHRTRQVVALGAVAQRARRLIRPQGRPASGGCLLLAAAIP